jgi:hypothetical protein
MVTTEIETPVGRVRAECPPEADKNEEIWSLWADSFGEVNAYALTFDQARKMVVPAVKEDGFEVEELSICPLFLEDLQNSQKRRRL